MSRYREAKIIAAVACPVCRAGVGVPCRGFPQAGRPQVHPPRKLAWQAQQRSHPPEFVLTPLAPPPGERTQYMLVCPQTAEARDWLAAMTAYPMIGGAAKVPHADMPELTKQIIADGWRTGDAI